ncbi:MAG: ribonuclease Z [Deltaproteobacteria bacterium]|nr:ribonuclease Z [Deltaproteobacteria bacterium]MBW1795931.1 ribonuclease Z [Deltaproteobacteria bacterium]
MIEVIFLGVGEAFDEELPNTSILIRCEVGTSPVTLLLDCGFTAPPQFWREVPEVDVLDGIWISHFHGDHSLGLPALLVRFWEEGRSKVLTLLGQKGIDSFTRKSLDLAYPGFYEKLEFPIRFLEVEPKKDVEIFGLTLQAAENSHSQRDLALRIDAQQKSIYYSGDGKPTPESMDLAKGSQLIIHEAFHMESEVPGHGTVTGSIDMAKRCEASNLALVHIQRKVRRQVIDRMEQFKDLAGSLNVMVPEPGYRITL